MKPYLNYSGVAVLAHRGGSIESFENTIEILIVALEIAKDMLHQWQMALDKMQAEEQMVEAAMTSAANAGPASTPTTTPSCQGA